MITELRKRHGKDADLKMHRGKVHGYFGMRLDYRTQGKLKIDMTEYLSKIFKDMPKKHKGQAVTSATNHICEVNKMARKFSKDDGHIFHIIVAKLLFLIKRPRTEILTRMKSLTTRVREPDEDNENKPIRVLKYLQSTRDLVLILESDGSRKTKWWASKEFAVHHGMKSHTDVKMLMGKGAVYSASSKHNLNTKRSTEAELVGVDDRMPQIRWMWFFWRLRASKCQIISFIKIIKSLWTWKNMDEHLVVSEPGT